jgi:competence protein ComEA
MKNWWGIPYGILIGLLAAGLILLVSRQPRGKPIELLPTPTPAPLVVYIHGAVQNPGVYALPQGSRIADAVQAAGGFSANASVQEIDLAAKLVDGQTILITTDSQP